LQRIHREQRNVVVELVTKQLLSEWRTVMNVCLRYGMIAAALLGSVGLATAQTFPKGAPGNNDNMMVSPADTAAAQPLNDSSAAASATPAKKHKTKHAGASHKQHTGT